MTTVFINYRRDDAASEAQRIASAVWGAGLPRDAVFMDMGIEAGQTWPHRIQEALASSTYMVVVIGPRWLTAGCNEYGQRRIDEETDWVRREIATALTDPRKTVIPVLVDGLEKMPPASAVPKDLADLANRQALHIRRDYWEHDVALVLSRLGLPNERPKFNARVEGSPVEPFWSTLSADLQKAIALAATAAGQEGKSVISTRTLFAALVRLVPESLGDLLDLLPKDALPKPLPATLAIEPSAFASIQTLSGCVQDSLEQLAPRSNEERRVTAPDMFVDIAKHGRGSSVQRLRTHGVDPQRINEAVRQLGWNILDRGSP